MKRVFKIAAQVFENIEGDDTLYMYYGHPLESQKEGFKPVLRIYENGKIVILSATDKDSIHLDFRDRKNLDTRFHGRYDPIEKVITCLKPERFGLRDTPSALIHKLEKEFPRSEKIYTYPVD